MYAFVRCGAIDLAFGDRSRRLGRRAESGDSIGQDLQLQWNFPTMAHTRLRKFNTRDTYPDQSLDNDLCQAVVANGTVYLRGQVGTDFDGNLVGKDDAAAQTDQAMRNVETLLKEAGARLEDIVKITIFITRRQDREPVYRTVGKWLKGVFPVSTGLMVAGLAKEEWLMEIDVIAVIPKE